MRRAKRIYFTELRRGAGILVSILVSSAALPQGSLADTETGTATYPTASATGTAERNSAEGPTFAGPDRELRAVVDAAVMDLPDYWWTGITADFAVPPKCLPPDLECFDERRGSPDLYRSICCLPSQTCAHTESGQPQCLPITKCENPEYSVPCIDSTGGGCCRTGDRCVVDPQNGSATCQKGAEVRALTAPVADANKCPDIEHAALCAGQGYQGCCATGSLCGGPDPERPTIPFCCADKYKFAVFTGGDGRCEVLDPAISGVSCKRFPEGSQTTTHCCKNSQPFQIQTGAQSWGYFCCPAGSWVPPGASQCVRLLGSHNLASLTNEGDHRFLKSLIGVERSDLL